MMTTPPYQKTGRVLFDALLLTAYAYGSTSITHDGKIITRTYNGKPFIIPTTGKTSCIDILVAIGLIQPVRKELQRAA
jgi:hypothetical protein